MKHLYRFLTHVQLNESVVVYKYNTNRELTSKQKMLWEDRRGIEFGRHMSGLKYMDTDSPELYGTEEVDEDKVEAIVSALKNGVELPPLLIDYDGGILDGHHRWEAANRLGVEKIPVVVYEFPGMEEDTNSPELYDAAKEFRYAIWVPYQRREITGVEANRLFSELSERTGFSQEEIQDAAAYYGDFTVSRPTEKKKMDGSLTESQVMDELLDRIKEKGMGSLTEYERTVLDRLSKGEYSHVSKREEVMEWLDSEMSGGHYEEGERNSMGSVFHYVEFYDIYGNIVAELELYREKGTQRREINKMSLVSPILRKLRNYYKLSESELNDILQYWFNKNYYDVTEWRNISFDELFVNEF